MNQAKPAGVLMMTGGLLILVTIFFEYQIGWIGVARDPADLPAFVLNQWSDLQVIWSFQMLGHGLLAVAYLLLCVSNSSILAVVWATLSLLAVLVVVAFGITVGGYEPALLVYENQPAVFESLRGSVRGLYTPGGLGGIALFSLLFVAESFRSGGTIGKHLGGVTLGFFVLCLVIGAVTSLTMKVTGASWFLLPVVMGYSLTKTR